MTAPVLVLETLMDDTEAQLAAALDALRQGDAVDLQALAPRVQDICRIAVADGRRDMAPRLLAVTASLDALEALLRDRLAAAEAPAVGTPHHRGAALYRTAHETLAGGEDSSPHDDKDRTS
jgi:hypothetical protein